MASIRRSTSGSPARREDAGTVGLKSLRWYRLLEMVGRTYIVLLRTPYAALQYVVAARVELHDESPHIFRCGWEVCCDVPH
jgi:hypothetical protein